MAILTADGLQFVRWNCQHSLEGVFGLGAFLPAETMVHNEEVYFDVMYHGLVVVCFPGGLFIDDSRMLLLTLHRWTNTCSMCTTELVVCIIQQYWSYGSCGTLLRLLPAPIFALAYSIIHQ